MLKSFALQAVDFLFPKAAEIYDLERMTAGDLLKQLEPARDTTADTVSIFNYADNRVRLLIWELKYRKNTVIARTLASILFDVVQTELAERALSENFANPLLVPMPMPASRRRERGFNQTEVLCQEMLMLDTLHILEYAPHILSKDHAESQARTHSKRDRLSNVEHTMHIKDPDTVRGRNIVLIDDVTTTGATLHEARRVLKEFGARKILALTIAH